jgi:hypothetical protein
MVMGYDEHGSAYPEPPNDDSSVRVKLSVGKYSLDHGETWHTGDDFAAMMALHERVLREAREQRKPAPWAPLALIVFAIFFVIFVLLMLFTTPAPAMDHGFDPTNQTVKWFERKMIPNITFQQSCCGKADAYPVARVRRNTNQTWSVWLADGSAIKYPDGTKREPFDENTEIVVPDSKVNPPDDDLDNPTDVGWIFMRVSNPTNPGAIYCLIIHEEGN